MTYNTLNKEHHSTVDVSQLVAIFLLMAISVAFVYSATMANEGVAALAWYKQSWFRQIIWFGLGMGAASVVCLVDYHTLTRWAFVAYWLTILTLIAVIIPGIGSMRYGARRWIEIGGQPFQPSEFAKLAFILAQAHFLSRPVDELRQPRIFWKSIAMLGLPFLLILKEPDLGSALVLVPTGFAMLLAAGTPKRYILQLLGIGGVLAVLFVADVLYAPPKFRLPMQDYQKKRLLVYFGRDYGDYAGPGTSQAERLKLREQQFNDSHNVRQALIAVGSGGLTGEGWRQGQQNSLGFLPQAGKHNDFIFSVIAEEKGFVGSVIVITLYAVILFTGIRIAGQARDRLGKLLAVGVVTLIFSHVFINIGMNIRIMPVTGVPLPLLSYGGSSVLGSLIAMGMLQNVYIYRKAY
ncbi:FtsW/RodA/SpoVE family cell cycle protein [Pedosphaera parvula]|uniref:Cell wall polymerase n=1 Tax=Pedosphaera parvula (strain Ellin514) TaxID=320771 RepID=B9XG17_PEDPL|nr:FtsW/RodA/SpoVE family cell cycle protein [Pedosphaera parvula]EEF61179.1 rod shape-determining protein RodA [Pedosphaera parvula Ellin514]